MGEEVEQVMEKQDLQLKVNVADKLRDDAGEDEEIAADLKFNSMKDFEPESIVNQVDPLKKLLDVRGKLKDLQSRAEGNDRLEEMLNAVIDDEAMREKLKDATGAEAPQIGGGDDADAGEGGE